MFISISSAEECLFFLHMRKVSQNLIRVAMPITKIQVWSGTEFTFELRRQSLPNQCPHLAKNNIISGKAINTESQFQDSSSNDPTHLDRQHSNTNPPPTHEHPCPTHLYRLSRTETQLCLQLARVQALAGMRKAQFQFISL